MCCSVAISQMLLDCSEFLQLRFNPLFAKADLRFCLTVPMLSYSVSYHVYLMFTLFPTGLTGKNEVQANNSCCEYFVLSLVAFCVISFSLGFDMLLNGLCSV